MFTKLRYAQKTSLAAAMRLRWVSLVLSALTLLFLGFLYGWSILAVPLRESFGWTTGDLALTFTLSTATFCVGGVIGAQLTRRTAPRLTLWLSALLIAGGYFASAQAGANDIHIIYICYGIFVGGASGMAHNAILGCTNNWFPDRVGTSSGALTLGFGLGSLVIGPLVGAAIDEWGWQHAYLLLGTITALVVLAGSVVIRYPAPDQALPLAGTPVTTKPSGVPAVPASPAASRRAKAARTSISGLNFSTRQMLRCLPFYLTFTVAVLLAAIYLATMGNAKLIALELGAAATLATVMVGMVSLGDGISRLASGLFFDRFGYRISLIIVASCFIASALTLFAAYSLAQLGLVVAGFIFLGLGFGALSTVLAAITNRFYGPKNYGSNLSVAYLDFVPASVLGPPLLGFAQAAFGSFQVAFLILATFGIVALIFALFIYPPRELPGAPQPVYPSSPL
ncbi:MAG: MFS transporter [Coriobacteriales bacterium]|jgi:OFA family oxalate/formate antiporter-like MFS transporter|nr:MFS transporter [Coriobacteriales bacterium]